MRETTNLLERGLTPLGKPIQDAKEAEAHQRLFQEIQELRISISLQAILYWYKRLFEFTKEDIAGKIRQHHIAISGSKFEPPLPLEVYLLLREFLRWYERSKRKLPQSNWRP